MKCYSIVLTWLSVSLTNVLWVDCKDEYPKACEDWSKKGECKANPGWMHLHCEKSCGICTPGGEWKLLYLLVNGGEVGQVRATVWHSLMKGRGVESMWSL